MGGWIENRQAIYLLHTSAPLGFALLWSELQNPFYGPDLSVVLVVKSLMLPTFVLAEDMIDMILL